MTTILTKRLTKLKKQLQYHQSELEYIEEVLKDWHHKFEDFQKEYTMERQRTVSILWYN